MRVNKKNFLHNFLENLLLFIAGLIFAMCLFATICGDGDKGLYSLLN